MTNHLVGAYGPFDSNIDDQAIAAFAEAMEHFVGVKYSPVAVAVQVVSGTNYAFFCNAEIVVPGSSVYPTMVNVYQPLKGAAEITHIEKLKF